MPCRAAISSFRRFILSSFRLFVAEDSVLAGRQAVLVLAAIKVGGATAMSIWHSTFYGGIAESDYGIDTQVIPRAPAPGVSNVLPSWSSRRRFLAILSGLGLVGTVSSRR